MANDLEKTAKSIGAARHCSTVILLAELATRQFTEKEKELVRDLKTHCPKQGPELLYYLKKNWLKENHDRISLEELKMITR